MDVLELKQVSVSYSETPVIEDINLVLKRGELVSILGESGVGKTTLFHTIAGLLPIDTGQIILSGENIANQVGKLSYMQQKDLLFPFKTIEDNVILPYVLRGMKKKEARERVQKYFEIFGITGTQKLYPAQLSGGMRQRASFLRTYLYGQDVILLDEPFGSLDPFTRFKIHNWFLDISKQMNLSTVLITHDIDEALILSDRIYILKNKPGKIVFECHTGNKPAQVDDYVTSEKFIKLKKEILEILHT